MLIFNLGDIESKWIFAASQLTTRPTLVTSSWCTWKCKPAIHPKNYIDCAYIEHQEIWHLAIATTTKKICQNGSVWWLTEAVLYCKLFLLPWLSTCFTFVCFTLHDNWCWSILTIQRWKKRKKTIDFNAWNNWTISQYNLLSSVGIYQKLTFGYI